MSARVEGRVRILFIVRQLEIGGAERQLFTLARGLDPARFEVHVAPMYAGGQLEAAFQAVPHITVHRLAKQGRWDVGPFLGRLVRLARSLRPDIVHGYMGGANELASLAAKASGARSVWGIRVSDLDPSQYVWSVGALFRLGAKLSSTVDLIIANSERGRQFHLDAGYDARRFIVIPNGIDTERFAPRPAARVTWRTAHGVTDDETLVLVPARLDPMKDHPTFLRAFAALRDVPRVRAICLGDGPDDLRAQYGALASSLGIGDRVQFLAAQKEVQDAYAAADVVALTSAFGEGFPNVLGEAMACGRLCVATKVGDAALVIGAPDRSLDVGDVPRLAETLRRCVLMSPEERESIGRQSRERMVSQFSVPALIERSGTAFTTLTNAVASPTLAHA